MFVLDNLDDKNTFWVFIIYQVFQENYMRIKTWFAVGLGVGRCIN